MFTEYEKLLNSENYVTKRQSLKVRLHSRSPLGFCLSLNGATPYTTVMSVYLSVCLQLLGELLLDRYNFTVMTKYISKPENLKLMMNLLRDNSRNIQFEAFHVFKVKQLPFADTSDCTCPFLSKQHLVCIPKVFVANPNKTQPVLDILLKNQTKLVEFLSQFQTDRSEDEQFCDEKNYLIKQIRDLKRPVAPEEA